MELRKLSSSADSVRQHTTDHDKVVIALRKSRRRCIMTFTTTILSVLAMLASLIYVLVLRSRAYPAYKPLRYVLAEAYVGENFFEHFDYFTG